MRPVNIAIVHYLAGHLVERSRFVRLDRPFTRLWLRADEVGALFRLVLASLAVRVLSANGDELYRDEEADEYEAQRP